MRKLLLISVLALILLNKSEGQVFSIGIDLGFIQMSTKVNDGGTNIFVPHQSVGFDIAENMKRFYMKYTNKMVYEIDYSRAVYSSYICTKGNNISLPGIKQCIGEVFSTNQINFGIGKEIHPIKKLTMIPIIGFGYVSFENFFKGSQPIGLANDIGDSFKWSYSTDFTNIREDNFNINAKLEALYKINPMLKMKLFYQFQQGLCRIYENNIIAWMPNNLDELKPPQDITKLKYAKNESNGSNSQIGFGVEITLNPSIKPNVK